MEDILTQVKTMEKDGVPQEQIQRIVDAYNSKKTTTGRKGTLGGNIINRIIQAPASTAVRTGELLGYAGIKGVAAITGNKELSQKADTTLDEMNASTQKVPGAFGSDINVKSTTDKTIGGALGQSTAEGLETVSLGLGVVKPFVGAGLAARGANYLAQVGTGYISDVAGNIIDDAESPAKPGLATAIAALSPAFSPIIKGITAGVKGAPGGLAKIGRIIKSSLTDSAEVIQAKKAAKIIEDMPFNVVTGEKAIGESKVGIARAADIISETKNNMGVTGAVTPARFLDIFKQSTSDVAKAGRQAAINAEEAGLHNQKPGWLKPLTDKLDELGLADGDKEIKDLFTSVKNDLGKAEITPTRLFDWLQTANENYGSTAQKAKKLREIADAGREAIDNVTDRGSYRDSYRAMMEYKKMLVMAIRKTEKKSDFSDLVSDVAVDIAFASQFANPAFLLRGVTQNLLGRAFGKAKNAKQLKNLMDLVDIAGDLRKGSDMPNKVPKYNQLPASTVPGKTVASNPTIIKPAVDFVTDPFGKTIKAQKGLRVDPSGRVITPGESPKAMQEGVPEIIRYAKTTIEEERIVQAGKELSEIIKKLPSLKDIKKVINSGKFLPTPEERLLLPSSESAEDALKMGRATIIVDKEGIAHISKNLTETLQQIAKRTGRKVEDFAYSEQGKLLLSGAGIAALLGFGEANSTEAAVKDKPNPETKEFSDKRKEEVGMIPGTEHAKVTSEDTKLIEKAIKTYEKIFPKDKENYGFSISPREIQALYSKESSAGADDADSGDKTRYNGYSWLMGMENNTIKDFVDSTKDRNKKIAPYLKNLDTPEKAFIAAVLIWRMSKIKTEPDTNKEGKDTGSLRFKGVRTPEETYKEYNGGGNPTAQKEYQQIINYY